MTVFLKNPEEIYKSYTDQMTYVHNCDREGLFSKHKIRGL